MATLYHVVILGAVLATAGVQPTEKVILYEVGDSGGCPGDIVTLNCSVPNSILEWYCTDDHIQIHCNNNDDDLIPIMCHNQILSPKSHECNLDGTRITSVVDITISYNNTKWTCMNPQLISQNDSVNVTVKVPTEVTLTWSLIRYNDNDTFGVVNVSWQKNTKVQYYNQTYNVTVDPPMPGCNNSCVTANQFKELTLATGTGYKVTVVTEMCNGKLKSAKSQPLLISLKGSSHSSIGFHSSSTIALPSSTTFPTSSTPFPSSSNKLLGLLTLALLPAGAIIAAIVAAVFLFRKICNRKDSFNAMKCIRESSITKMEAGRSTFHNDKIYYAPFGSRKCYIYSVCSEGEKWDTLDKDMRYTNPGLAIIDGSVATVGGHDNDKPTDQVWVWKGGDWKQEKSMKVKRSDPAVISSKYEKYVLAISGNLCTKEDISWVRDVEVYDTTVEPCARQWRQVCLLPGSHVGIEATLCNGTVYVIPASYEYGFQCKLETLVSSKEEDNCWDNIKRCPLRLSTPTSCADRLMCIGGANVKDVGLNHVYVYEPNKKCWKKVGYLPGGGRIYTMVEVCENNLVVVGGKSEHTHDSSKCLDRVEIFVLNSYWSKESKKSV